MLLHSRFGGCRPVLLFSPWLVNKDNELMKKAVKGCMGANKRRLNPDKMEEQVVGASCVWVKHVGYNMSWEGLHSP